MLPERMNWSPAAAPSRPLVLLHGFCGSPEDYRAVVEPAGLGGLALTLPGHGPEAVAPGGFEANARSLLARAPSSPFDLVGYSLGGRLAMAMAALAPERVRRLFIIGAHPGLGEDEAARARRRALDEARANALRTNATRFFESWDALPLFASPTTARHQAHRARRAHHDPHGLADAMAALSLGAMPDLRPAILSKREDLTLCVGAEDEKYRSIYAPWSAALGCQLVEVEGAHHRVPLDAPVALGRALACWRGGGGTGELRETQSSEPQ